MNQLQTQSTPTRSTLSSYLLPIVPLLCTSFLIQPLVHKVIQPLVDKVLSELGQVDYMPFPFYYLVAFCIQFPVFWVMHRGATENIENERKAMLEAQADHQQHMPRKSYKDFYDVIRVLDRIGAWRPERRSLDLSYDRTITPWLVIRVLFSSSFVLLVLNAIVLGIMGTAFFWYAIVLKTHVPFLMKEFFGENAGGFWQTTVAVAVVHLIPAAFIYARIVFSGPKRKEEVKTTPTRSIDND